MNSENKSLEKFLRSISFLLTFFLLSRAPIDADLWWHLRAGQLMWQKGEILLNDVFSYTKLGSNWVNAFWVSEVLLYWIHRIGGYFLLSFFVSLIGAITFLIVFSSMKGISLLRSFILILAVITAAPIWGPRPQILSFFLVAFLDLWLNQPSRHRWLLMPIFALWANIHGGWIWGFLLLIAHIAGLFVNSFFVEDKKKLRTEGLHLIGWTVLSALAVGINPNGIYIWKLPFQQVNVSLQIQEWLSPDFHRLDFHPMLWMLFLLILLAPFAQKPLQMGQILKTIGFAYLTFVAQRNVALFAIVAAPLLADWANNIIQLIPLSLNSPTGSSALKPAFQKFINGFILIILTLTALGNLYVITQNSRIDSNYPVNGVAWLREHEPQGKLFNSYNWGGYLLWTLPEYSVFIDGRADLYGNEILGQWQDVVNARENAEEILNTWQVNIVFIEPYWDIVPVLKEKGWHVKYEDKSSIILIRP